MLNYVKCSSRRSGSAGVQVVNVGVETVHGIQTWTSPRAAKECGVMNDLGQIPKRVTIVGRNEEQRKGLKLVSIAQGIAKVDESKQSLHTKTRRHKH